MTTQPNPPLPATPTPTPTPTHEGVLAIVKRLCAHGGEYSPNIEERLRLAAYVELRRQEDAKLESALNVILWCVGYASRADDAGALRAVLRENGFIQ